MNSALNLFLVLALFGALAALSRWRDRPDRPPGMLWRFWPNTLAAFGGRRWVFPFFAAGLTAGLVLSGLDRRLQDWWQAADPLGHALPWALLVWGNFWTPVVALVVYLVGRYGGRDGLRVTGVASMQAVLSVFVVTHTLKVLTGRHGPLDPLRPDHAPFPKVEDAGDFAFDFWNHAMSDGRWFWPSGHTSSAMAFITALVICLPGVRWIAIAGYALVLFVGWAMIDGNFHWVSDVAAGLLLGGPIGWTVARAVRAEDVRRRVAAAGRADPARPSR